jgi:hypothetical protein
MNTIRIGLALATIALSSSAFAADTAKAQYDAERARCMSGTTGQDQASCLKSAGAAYDSAKAGRLNDPNTDYRANAMRRCAALPAADKADCESRVDGQGISSGSVKGGGMVKETVTRTVYPSETTTTNQPAPR